MSHLSTFSPFNEFFAFIIPQVPSAFALESLQTFNPLRNKESFVIENREDLGDIQALPSLAKYMKQFTKDEYMEAFLDFHLLIYLASMNVYPLYVSVQYLSRNPVLFFTLPFATEIFVMFLQDIFLIIRILKVLSNFMEFVDCFVSSANPV